MITMEQKYQPRICQQEFLHEGSSQSACQSFRALKRNLAQTVGPWNYLHSYCTGTTSLGTSVPDHSASLNQHRREKSLWLEETGLEGQDAELNSTAPGNRTCVRREPDGRWWHRLSCLWKQHCQHLAKAKGRNRALRCLHRVLQPHELRRKLCSNHTRPYTQLHSHTSAAKVQGDRLCTILHTCIMQKRNSVRMVCCDYRGGRRNSGGEENTYKCRKIAQ